MKRQQFPDRPAMIRDASRHRRGCPSPEVGETRMWRAKIIDRADKPTVSPAKNSLVYFISIGYIDHPV